MTALGSEMDTGLDLSKGHSLRAVERYLSHSQPFVQADCSGWIVSLDLQINVLRATTPELPKCGPQ